MIATIGRPRLRWIALTASVCVFFSAGPSLGQTPPPAPPPVEGGTEPLDPTNPLVTGGALRARRPGNVINRARARFQEATARVGQRFPLQSVDGGAGAEEPKFFAQLLNSVLETVFDSINTFLSVGNLLTTFGQNDSGIDLGGLLGELGNLSSAPGTAPAARAVDLAGEPPVPPAVLVPLVESAAPSGASGS